MKNYWLGGAAVLCLSLAGCGESGPAVNGGVGVSADGTPAAKACVVGATPRSWIAGTTALCQGALVYLDYVNDDYGADSGALTMPLKNGSLAPSAGDATYPAGAENTADLVRLQLQLSGDFIEVEAELNTLYTADQTLLAIAVDTDNDAATGGGAWPGISGVGSSGWDAVYVFKTGDPATNLIRGRFPRPGAAQFRVWAVTAQADGTVMNVAFRGPDETAAYGSTKILLASTSTGSFWDDKQAAALKAGDITAFAATLDTRKMLAGVTEPATVGPGLHQRVYTSAYTLAPGEGLDPTGVPGRNGATGKLCEQAFNFRGKYQTYGIYLPAQSQPGPRALQVLMHGCSAANASQINEPGFQQTFGETLNRIIVAPQGRGPSGFYSDISERDVLDVLDDAQANYPVDVDQIHVSGYSMGGYGTLRLGALYPDRWASAVDWVGFSGNGLNTPLPGNPLTGVDPPVGGANAIDNPVDLVGNFRDIPIVALYSSEDELITQNSQLALRQSFANADGVESDFYIHTPAEHLTYLLLDSWDKEALFSKGRVRQNQPAHVTFRTDASLDFPQYGISHDKAYWISGIVSRAAGYADTDLASSGCGQPTPTYQAGNDAGVGPTPLTWVRTYRHRTGTVPAAVPVALTGTISNVSALRLDTDAICLSGKTFHYRLTTDGPLSITLSDGRSIRLANGTSEGQLQ